MKKRVNNMIRLFTLSIFKKLIGYIKKVANPPVGGLATFHSKRFSISISYPQ